MGARGYVAEKAPGVSPGESLRAYERFCIRVREVIKGNFREDDTKYRHEEIRIHYFFFVMFCVRVQGAVRSYLMVRACTHDLPPASASILSV